MADSPELLGHPRPLLRRDSYALLDGQWDFADDPDGRWRRPEQVTWDATIEVPYAPEAPASGIGTTHYRKSCWYRTRQTLGGPEPGGRLVLHFGAVDSRATVWVDGAKAGEHEGGYTPFSVDLTDHADGREHSIVVRAEDDPLDLAKTHASRLGGAAARHLVPAHQRNLAVGVARAAARGVGGQAALDARPPPLCAAD